MTNGPRVACHSIGVECTRLQSKSTTRASSLHRTAKPPEQKNRHRQNTDMAVEMVRLARVELATYSFGGCHSIQLSYRRKNE